MLKQRIITSLFLIPIFLALLFYANLTVFVGAMTLVTILASWEWSRLMGITHKGVQLIYPLMIVSIIALFLKFTIYLSILFKMTAVFWLIAMLLIFTYPKSAFLWNQSKFIRGLMGVFVIVPCWFAVNFIWIFFPVGSLMLSYLFVLIWGADIAAYFVGRAWGNKKLAAAVSPGKTIMGALGAIVLTQPIAFGAALWIKAPAKEFILFMILSLLVVLVSMIGDLFESMLKREVNIKDSSNLLPGHGGILDRIDSLTAAAPIFVLGILLILR